MYWTVTSFAKLGLEEVRCCTYVRTLCLYLLRCPDSLYHYAVHLAVSLRAAFAALLVWPPSVYCFAPLLRSGRMLKSGRRRSLYFHYIWYWIPLHKVVNEAAFLVNQPHDSRSSFDVKEFLSTVATSLVRLCWNSVQGMFTTKYWKIASYMKMGGIKNMIYLRALVNFQARSQNFEKRLLASSCLSVRVEQLGFHWKDFHKIWYLSIFRKSVEDIRGSLKSDNNNGYFTRRPMYIYDISLNSS
jgi:hypothetical protein